MTKTSTHMLVKNYKRTQNIVHVNQRMKYENEYSVQETNKYSSQAPHAPHVPQNAKSSVQETLQNMKIERVNN